MATRPMPREFPDGRRRAPFVVWRPCGPMRAPAIRWYNGGTIVMGANMLDTYTLVKRLTQAGIPEAQAAAHMSVFLDMSERGFATKGDIAALRERIDDLANHVAGMDVRLSGVELRLSEMDTRLSSVERRLSEMDTRLSSVELRLSEFDARLSGIERRLSEFDTRLSGIERRLSELDARLSKMDTRLSGIELHLSGMELRLMVRLGGLIVTLMSVGFGVLEFTLAH